MTIPNTAVDLTDQNEQISHLMPEILTYIVPVAHEPAVCGPHTEWLVGLRDPITRLIMNGTLRGTLASAWHHYMTAITTIQAGQPELIDPIAAGWIGIDAAS